MLIAAALAVCLSLPSLHAQAPHCGTRGPLLERLGAQFGEHIVHRGISARGAMLEITVNRATGTWTVLFTALGGPTCIVGSGDGWIDIKVEPTGPET